MSVVRALASEGRFRCILGVNPGFLQARMPALSTLELPALDGERLGLRTFWRARGVAHALRSWLSGDSGRVFHGHSRAGLAVALWLARSDARQVVASVHCYGRQRWFYRWAARQLGGRLFWLSPAMKHYYIGGNGGSWDQCIPGCIASESANGLGKPRASHRPVRLGGIGALVPWKRWDLVLEALARLPEAARNKLRFAHIGAPDGSDISLRCASSLRAQTAALGLGGIVEWRGQQPSTGDFLCETDCIVIASHNEPFSMAMLEALSAGVPVLAADSGGARDILTPPRNGWLFHSGDAGDLARSLLMLAETDALGGIRIEPGDLLRFSAPHVAGQWAQAYSRLSGEER